MASLKIKIISANTDSLEAEGEAYEVSWLVEWWWANKNGNAEAAVQVGQLAAKLEKSNSQLASAVRANSGAVGTGG